MLTISAVFLLCNSHFPSAQILHLSFVTKNIYVIQVSPGLVPNPSSATHCLKGQNSETGVGEKAGLLCSGSWLPGKVVAVSQDHLQSEVQGESILKGSSREMGGVCTRKGQFVSCSQGHLPALWRLCAETGVSLSVVSRGLQARFLNSERSGERAAWRE